MFKRFYRKQKFNELAAIHSADKFITIIARECARVDRNSHVLSMIIFDVGKSNGELETVQRLVSALAPRVRSIDEIGWLDDGSLGVVLPYTSAAGACKLVSEVRQALTQTSRSFDCEVYTYPRHWISGNKGDPK